MIQIKTQAEIELMRESGQILAIVLNKVIDAVQPGITTKELAVIADNEVRRLGAEPAFLGYSGFPDVICISINDQVVHGIPGGQVIKKGDIVSLDFGVKFKGMVTDSARSILVNSTDTIRQKLIDGTQKSLNAGIAVVKSGKHIGDIGAAVQAVLESYGLGVVRDLVGHGVGRLVHEDPDVPNYGNSGTGPELSSGMTIAIEPMSTLGSYEVYTAADGWSVVTKDGSLSAHFEDTILVTEAGSEILTRLKL
ncbi:MAG TPA: type I methionyl aminopeptidase [Patescibacteria group bacterium]|nr:type I methionyl aminopeptidase [Patescibacteria group bacterium]